MTKQRAQMCVGLGWSRIISDLWDDLVALGWDQTVLQVKEKFGGLRFYIGLGNDQIWDRIDEAERLSYKTCEECGKPGVLRASGWLKTHCDEHSEGYPPYRSGDMP